MAERKCIACGEEAFAYRIEADSSKTYLCLDHFPDGEAPRHWGQNRPPVKSEPPVKLE